jgi:hypothetical protein
VSHIENVTGELRAMASGIDRAQANAAGADNTAQEIAARAAGSGFAGIAAGMSGLRRSIAEIRARLAGVGVSLNEAATAVAATPREISPEQTVAALAPAQEKVGGIRDDVVAIIATVEETKRLAAAALHGGQPGPMISALEAVKEILVLVAQRGGTAKQHVETAISAARQTGQQGN